MSANYAVEKGARQARGWKGFSSRAVGAMVCLLAVLMTAGSAWADDADSDGISDDREAQILAEFSPVIYSDNSNEVFPPLPVEWMIRRCQLRWYYQPGGNNPADRGNELLLATFGADYKLTTDLLNSLFPSTWPEDEWHRFRLTFKNGGNHHGDDLNPPEGEPSDERTWSSAQARQDCMYGRCSPFNTNMTDSAAIESAGQYRVQYYLFFGWDDVNADRNCYCCPLGNHEGDVICVEFWVEWQPGGTSRIIAPVFHNHGRQVFVDSTSRLRIEGGRPVVFLERDNHEALPWSGTAGICATAPTGISANKIWASNLIPCPFVSLCQPGTPLQRVGGECDDVPVVRNHTGDDGSGSRLLITSVNNLGEPGRPYPDSVSRFLHNYRGLLGDDASDSCDIFTFPVEFTDTNCPESPIHQGKMWDSDWQRGEVYVEFGRTDRNQTGEPEHPVASLPLGVWMTRPYGTSRVRAGAYPDRLTLTKPVTITAEGGMVTIGQ
jgi:hypothetical protein